MGYRNNNVGYIDDLLTSRSIIKKNNYAIIDVDGLVNNVVPGFVNTTMSILASPKLGASFVDYIGTMHKDGYNEIGFGGNGVETFIYVISGKIKVSDGVEEYVLDSGSYLYVPSYKQMFLENVEDGDSEFYLYKRRYEELEDYQAYTYFSNINQLENIKLEDMEDVKLYNLLPTTLDFDLNFHILSFAPGASHGYVETHIQEHGAIVLEGEGMYNLDNNWYPVKKGDYIFMAAYCPQAGYGITRNQQYFTYLYSKDCNRDEKI